MGNSQDKSENSINFNKQELKILYMNFQDLDKDKSGSIEPSELFSVPELKDNPIVQRIISVFDKNKDGKISFYEFIIGLSALTNTGNNEEKLKIAFQIYDMNSDGYISNGDLFKMLKILVRDSLTNIQLQILVDRTIIAADKDYDGKIGYDEFCEFVKNMRIEEMFSLNLFQK